MDSIEAWIAIDLMSHIGPRTVSRLIEVFGSPEGILKAKPSAIRAIDFLNTQQIDVLSVGPDMNAVKKVLRRLEEIHAYVVCLTDPDYPPILKEIVDPPSVLYVKGSLEDLQPAVAIVGTRSPSHYGVEVAFSLARDLSLQGISIVSGLARGIDTQAHLGALQGISKTVAVLGSGIDIIYPQENKQLTEEIAQKGAIISEFPPGFSPKAENFPRRNRIISGLCSAVIIVEATQQSGALITARHALEQGRLCMAVPGAINNIRSRGPHSLIRQGALLVESANDVITEIAPQLKGMLQEQAKAHQGGIIDLISGQPMNLEEIAVALKTDIMEAAKAITLLELKGDIERIEGNRFTARRKHA